MGDLGNHALVTIDGTDMKVQKGFNRKTSPTISLAVVLDMKLVFVL